MIKYVVLAGAAMIASSAFAQDRTPQAQSSSPATADQAAPAAQTAPAAPDQSTGPAAPATTGQPDTTAQAQPAPSTPAAAPTSVAAVVDSGFSKYDTNGDGKLSETEFAAWMDDLKKQGDPSAKHDAKYDLAAFTQADKDKNKAVSKSELIAFLSRGNS